MNTRSLAVLGCAFVLGTAGTALAQHDHSGHDHAGHDHSTHAKDDAAAAAAAESGFSEEEMAAWMATMMPGEQHKKLEFFVGDWTFVNHSNMGGVETTEEGTTHCSLMMGGRYLHTMHKGQSMGMPFEGAGITGYDNVAGEWFNVWFDNFGTGVLVSRGQEDENGDVIVTGEMLDPMTNESVGYRMVTKVTGEDTHTFELHMDSPEGEQRVMEVLYTRVKS
ncbi:MAG TPA: DUF1579 family protein [bacterium]|nr:DUF1579 family protein [bacterium]